MKEHIKKVQEGPFTFIVPYYKKNVQKRRVFLVFILFVLQVLSVDIVFQLIGWPQLEA